MSLHRPRVALRVLISLQIVPACDEIAPVHFKDEDQTVLWGWGAPAPVSEQNGARAPHPHEIFRLTRGWVL
jgi:hypothetical protein